MSARPAQSRLVSLAEAAANVVLGFIVAIGAQLLVFPVVGLQASLAQTVQIGAAFTVISLARSYLLRRLFEAIGR